MEQNHATSISGHYLYVKKGRLFNLEDLPFKNAYLHYLKMAPRFPIACMYMEDGD
ncbi:hypothetical protein [Bacillus thuringiensis]|uniref:hypothetical protein n=1 Tax=Bacillus thuringiensis TaxID=1428 RepID=UPI0015596B27|nr:hypothetical protein [Bacillus thuringiensis]